MLKENQIMDDPTSSLPVNELITNKWKVAYDDMSLECDGRLNPKAPTPWLSHCDVQIYFNDERDDASTTNNNQVGQDKAKTTARSEDCLDCPGMESNRELNPPCSCRKRKEPQNTLYEHEGKFSRSSSLQPEGEDAVGTSTELKQADLQDNHVLKEVQDPVQTNKKSSDRELYDTGGELKKRLRRRRKVKKETVHTVHTVHRDTVQYVHSKENQDQKEEVKPCTEAHVEAVPVDEAPPRKNALSFLYNNNNNSGPSCRKSSSPFPKTLPASPPNLRRINTSPELGAVLSAPSKQAAGCWVSEQLAHIMRVETEKETMSLQVDSPKSQYLLNSGRFMETHQQFLDNREGEKPRHKQLLKQLSTLKRKIEQLEEKLCERNGYRPSQQDKLQDRELQALLLEQRRLKREAKLERESGGEEGGGDLNRKQLAAVSPPLLKDKQLMEQRLEQILLRMDKNRVAKNRPYNYQDMSLDQICDEKLEMQTLLRDYEKDFGHPEGQEEKEVMKEVYERYRIIKRMARRSSQARSGDTPVNLITIPEDEEVDLTLVSPQHRIHVDILPQHKYPEETVSRHDMDLPSFLHSSDTEETAETGRKQWHDMSRPELLGIIRTLKEEKKVSRRAVKEFEDTFEQSRGRKITKEDREPLEDTYKTYKTCKSQLKLLNALLSKLDSKADQRTQR